ncbi:alanine racemase [Endozoicomonas sp. SESOKO1]|uniref:alanine racemase n=1 Tax=Endozoicomonas sp. SESOKO1 TaxID=2828742 RepID=UPI002148C14A|nr:alanine racemase [Endozoicomonas sp. SESOKO1]
MTHHYTNHRYFQDMGQSLKKAGLCSPTLVIDKRRLDYNINQLLKVIGQGFQYRIVAKSLPSIPLLRYIMERTGTRRLMSFHIPFLIHLVDNIPEADVLLGKPMPISAVRYFYHWQQQQSCGFRPESQLQWLVDSLARLQEYHAFARDNDLQLQINLEINIGLNRGGFSDLSEFQLALELLKDSDYLSLSGLMGYEAHITKIPVLLGGPETAFRTAMSRYREFTGQIQKVFVHQALERLCLNAGGSTTYPLYRDNTLINEIATASALVKPTDFDVFTLNHHSPAAFIAAPVIKDVHKPNLPMASGISALLRMVGLSPQRAAFIYGGNWLASPCYPAGSKRSGLLGHSSNQELYEIHKDHPIQRDDFMFFRPSQSEAVFLQFGHIAVMNDGIIESYWPVFQYPEHGSPSPETKRPLPKDLSASAAER